MLFCLDPDQLDLFSSIHCLLLVHWPLYLEWPSFASFMFRTPNEIAGFQDCDIVVRARVDRVDTGYFPLAGGIGPLI